MTHESVLGETLPADHITKTPNVIDKEGAQDDHADISQGVSADVSTPYEPSIATVPYALDHVAPLDPSHTQQNLCWSCSRVRRSGR